jgi:hypothetical protein
MFENEKIQEAYINSILSESTEKQVSQIISRVFPTVKVKKVEVKRKIVFHLSDFIDDEELNNFSNIDAINEFIKKKYKDAIVNWKGRTIEVEEL